MTVFDLIKQFVSKIYQVSPLAEHFCCGNILSLLIKLEKKSGLVFLGKVIWFNGLSTVDGLFDAKVLANGPGDRVFNPRSIHTKDSKMLLVALLNTQHYKIKIKGKVEQYSERSSAVPYTLV